MFKGILIEKDDAGYRANLTDIDEAQLPEGDVTVAVQYSTLNYKDGLAITGKGPVVRKFPMVPGIDIAGTVEASDNPDYKAGDRVVPGVIRALDDAGIDVLDVEVRRPTLDDVFLSLTGRRAEGDLEEAM